MRLRKLTIAAATAITALAFVVVGPAEAASDTAPPQVRLNPGLVFNVHSILGDNTLNPMIGPVGITFTASDDTGITYLDALATSYDQSLTEVGRWESNDNTALREMTPSIALNGRVDASVTASDAVGHTASSFASYSAHLLQQDAFSLTGRWYGGQRASWSGGTLIHSAKPGSTATYTFTGRSFAVIGSYGPDRGTLDVSWGSSSASVNTQGFFSPRAVIFSHRFNGAGPHTIRITVTSTTRVDLDGLIIQN
jgi:hypothetical protein